ncbi:MAG TPA: hypothetical protein VIV11_25505 [Kofleriaceae bacterium]
MMRALPLLLLATAFGCSTMPRRGRVMYSPRAPKSSTVADAPETWRCGMPEMPLYGQLLVGLFATALIGTAVGIGYVAIGGENPAK